jgi:hypothetical protein
MEESASQTVGAQDVIFLGAGGRQRRRVSIIAWEPDIGLEKQLTSCAISGIFLFNVRVDVDLFLKPI